MKWSSERRQDEVEKLFAQLGVGVAEEADARSTAAVVGSDADDGRIEP